MRLNVRTGAALVAIVVGLALIVVAAMGSNARLPGTLKAAPAIPIATGTGSASDPMSGVRRSDPLTSHDLPTTVDPSKASVFDTAYGDRGKHDVTVSIVANGRMGYLINWRNGKNEGGKSTSGVRRSRVISGGFPVVQVVARAAPPATKLTCTITVDGAQKTTQTTTQAWGAVVCLG